jgi:hypothetical protein
LRQTSSRLSSEAAESTIYDLNKGLRIDRIGPRVAMLALVLGLSSLVWALLAVFAFTDGHVISIAGGAVWIGLRNERRRSPRS